MKIKISIIIGILLCLLSACSSPESVAESALQKIGDGRYSEPIAGDLKFTRELVEGNEFSLALVANAKSLSFLEDGIVYDNIEKAVFQKDQLFNDWKLIDKREDKINLHRIREYQEADSAMYKHLDNIVKITDKYIVNIAYTDVPWYILRYKIDGTRIAALGVIKHPEHGYKVVSFMWEQ